jgi:hypothetical protein
MKKYYNPLLIILLLTFQNSCKKEEPIDYRDIVTGTYTGISIESILVVDSIFNHDTANIVILLSKAYTDSLINLTFNPPNKVAYTFKYSSGSFYLPSTIDTYTGIHYPWIWIVKDSLYFHHQPGLGPYFFDCYTKKQK